MAEEGAKPSLDEVRWRIDAIDEQLHALIDERAALARAVAEAKAAAGDAGKFGLRPGREAQVLRRLLARERKAASPAILIKIWRELMADSLARQGPFQLSVYGGSTPARTVELARLRFGATPGLTAVAKAEDALAAARKPGGVGVLALAAETPWWGRLLAAPSLKVFAALPCLAAWGPTGALAVAEVEVEPTGGDETFWVTDAARPAAGIEEALGRDGVAARLLADVGGLKLFGLAGFYMDGDERLSRAPGSLTGVIGAASAPFDV
jgi:chorismate mutase